MQTLEKTRRYLRATDIADMFGVTTRTVWAWVAEGLVPCHKIGRLVFFTQEDIDSLMSTNRFVCHVRSPLAV